MNKKEILALGLSIGTILHGMRVAMYIVGQEETAGESSVSVVAGVRTVTTNMDGRDVLPRLSRPFAFSTARFHFHLQIKCFRVNVPV